MAFVKAREKVIAAIERHDDDSIDKSSAVWMDRKGSILDVM